MKKIFWIAVFALGAGVQTAAADDLFHDGCVRMAEVSTDGQLLTVSATARGGVMGLRCEDLRGLHDAIRAIELALYPATLAITLSPMRDQLIAGLAELGLTMANPAVLGVTVLTATGAVVVYFILKKTMDECDRMDEQRLKESIIRELELKHGLSADPRSLRIRRN